MKNFFETDRMSTGASVVVPTGNLQSWVNTGNAMVNANASGYNFGLGVGSMSGTVNNPSSFQVAQPPRGKDKC